MRRSLLVSAGIGIGCMAQVLSPSAAWATYTNIGYGCYDDGTSNACGTLQDESTSFHLNARGAVDPHPGNYVNLNYVRLRMDGTVLTQGNGIGSTAYQVVYAGVASYRLNCHSYYSDFHWTTTVDSYVMTTPAAGYSICYT